MLSFLLKAGGEEFKYVAFWHQVAHLELGPPVLRLYGHLVVINFLLCVHSNIVAVAPILHDCREVRLHL